MDVNSPQSVNPERWGRLAPTFCREGNGAFIPLFVCSLTCADRKYIRVKETDSVKLNKKKTSVSFTLMYCLSAPATPVRQTEIEMHHNGAQR